MTLIIDMFDKNIKRSDIFLNSTIDLNLLIKRGFEVLVLGIVN